MGTPPVPPPRPIPTQETSVEEYSNYDQPMASYAALPHDEIEVEDEEDSEPVDLSGLIKMQERMVEFDVRFDMLNFEAREAEKRRLRSVCIFVSFVIPAVVEAINALLHFLK